MVLGAYFGSWAGAAVGLIIVLAMATRWGPLLHGVYHMPMLQGALRSGIAIWLAIRPALALALMPVVLPLTALIALLLHAVNVSSHPIKAPLAAVRRGIKRTRNSISGYCREFFAEDALPLTMANAVAIAIIIGVFARIEFATVAVFAGAPVMLLFLYAMSWQESTTAGGTE